MNQDNIFDQNMVQLNDHMKYLTYIVIALE